MFLLLIFRLALALALLMFSGSRPFGLFDLDLGLLEYDIGILLLLVWFSLFDDLYLLEYQKHKEKLT